MRHGNAVVIGGGPAGSMVALELARAGRPVSLLEKSKAAHDKVCGEFLSQESLRYLDRHGVDVRELGAVPIRHIRFVTPASSTRVELPFQAFSLPRRKLDEELLRIAALAGVELRRDAHVEGLHEVDGCWRADVRGGESSTGCDAFIATGKHDLRNWTRPDGIQQGLVAFKMYYQLSPAQHERLRDTVELILFPGGYAGLQPVAERTVNLCLLVAAKRLRQIGGGWDALLRHILDHAPHLSERLEGATSEWSAPLSAFQIPYGHLQTRAQSGLWRVGDQAAVIPSFCGDGMAIALHSGALAAAHLLRNRSSQTYQKELSTQLASRLWLATRISQLLVSLPQIANPVRWFPGLLSGIASMTRIPQHALMTVHGTFE